MITLRKNYFLCIESKACEDLEIKNIYKGRSDKRAEEEGYIKIIDDTGKDYLYPQSYFIALSLNSKTTEALELIN